MLKEQILVNKTMAYRPGAYFCTLLDLRNACCLCITTMTWSSRYKSCMTCKLEIFTILSFKTLKIKICQPCHRLPWEHKSSLGILARTGSDLKGSWTLCIRYLQSPHEKKVDGQNNSVLGNSFLSKPFLWSLEGTPLCFETWSLEFLSRAGLWPWFDKLLCLILRCVQRS